MASLQLTGKVVKVYPVQQVSEKFKKRVLVIEHGDNPQYLEMAVFEFPNDKVSLLDAYKAGDTVTVDFNVKGRAFQKPGEETKYFCSLQGWKISGTGTSPHNQGMGAPTNAPTVDDDDTSPF